MAKQLRLVEHYTSVQGEGPNTGKGTQFVRMAGCSMRCPLWPCDTEFAIEPKIFMKPGGSYKQSPMEVVEVAIENRSKTGARQICLTGGEPFLQPNDLMDELIKELHYRDFNVEAFSNGSFVYTETALEYVQIMMDWKLDGSGEGKSFLEERNINARLLKSGSGIKFVVKDNHDFDQAMLVWDDIKDEVSPGVTFWIGKAWGLIDDKDIVELVQKYQLPWRLNVQMHQYIFPVNARGK